MTNTTAEIATPRHTYASRAARIKAIRKVLLGKNRTETEVYTEEDVNTLINSPVVQKIVEIDADLIERCDLSAGAEAAVAKECEQFKIRLDYLESLLVLGAPEPVVYDGRTYFRPRTLAVLQVRQVPKEFGQTLTVSKNPAAPLWVSAEQRSGDVVDIRSTFRCSLDVYGTAEDIGFFDSSCRFDVPLLVQGFPTVLPNGERSFTITKFCLDIDQATQMRKERKARLEAEARVQREAAKAAKEKQREAIKAEKARAKAEAKAKREAAKAAKAANPNKPRRKAKPLSAAASS